MFVTIFDINKYALMPHQTHALLSKREGEMITNTITSMLEDSYCMDSETLKYVARFYTMDDFGRLIFKRNQYGRCGYPLCNQRLSNTSIDLNNCGSLDSYCSELHYDCTNFIITQLSDMPIYKRDGIHLINRYNLNKVNRENELFQIKLLEEILQEKTTEYDMDNMTDELNKFDLKPWLYISNALVQ